ncbi:C-type lectin domain family 12 member B-like [Danio aesculapii]|uniref:C-type lectin domain family 12 member B-like n=1 Tax=Danio aesculapii TaxID=1142201 RepID=UPI0024BF9F11|nr:C-type lectin domain family 12 member B-like [Danio aesculapii]
MTDVIYEEVEMNDIHRGESVEIMVDIYESADTVRCHDLKTNTETQQRRLQHTGSISVKSRKQRAGEVCLCLLCALLLTAVIVLIIQRKHLLTHITELNEERELMLNHNNNLTEERELMLNHNNNLTEEREQILNHITNLTKEREQIKKKTDELQHGFYTQDQLAENYKWLYYRSSFYYISSVKKSWSDSRRDCKQRQADLAIIKSPEEKKFLQKAAASSYFWIGLTQTDGVWKWIDGSSDW